MKQNIILTLTASTVFLAGCCTSHHANCCSRQKTVIPSRVCTPVGWTSSEVAAPDSVEGQLRAQGKHWFKITEEITAGAYVQDILEGRLGQPKGRGAIGKVVAVTTGDNGVRAAMVDFGRDYSVGIYLSELSLVGIVRE